MKLLSYEFKVISMCYEGPFAYAKDLLTGVKNNHKIWTCFLLFKNSPHDFKLCINSNILHKKWAMGHVFLHACIETFLHDWLKWFQMCLMIKIGS
jgi:hypothetical protein